MEVMEELNGKGIQGNRMFSRVMEFKLWIKRIVKKAWIDGKKCEANELEIPKRLENLHGWRSSSRELEVKENVVIGRLLK